MSSPKPATETKPETDKERRDRKFGWSKEDLDQLEVIPPDKPKK